MRPRMNPGSFTVTLGSAQFDINFIADQNVKVDLVSGTILKTWASLILVSGATQVEAMGIAGLTLTGNTGNNALIGAGGGDTLNGGDGNDLLFGRLWSHQTDSGDDIFLAATAMTGLWGDGADTLNGGDGMTAWSAAPATTR